MPSSVEEDAISATEVLSGSFIAATGVRVYWNQDAPVCVNWGASELVRAVPLVELFTTGEQRARTSQGYVRSAAGERLRYVQHHDETDRTRIEQHDPITGITVVTEITRAGSDSAWRIVQLIRNDGPGPLELTAVVTACAGLGHGEQGIDELELVHGRSEWLAEGRWRTERLRELLPAVNLELHEQDARGRYACVSLGAWSSGEVLPTGVIVDTRTDEALAWQVESSAGWVWELTQGREGAHLALSGPTDAEHAFAHVLEAGEAFESVPAVIVTSQRGRDGAFAELTAARRSTMNWNRADRVLPLVYNDFMNTTMGDPSSERLLPLIEAAASVGAEVFCIDAGWFAARESGADWWSTVGVWREGLGRFEGGLRALIDVIHKAGMASGLWLEPEVVGVSSPAADLLPHDAFLQRGGRRVVEDRRYHLDFRHPAARAHLDETVDHLVRDYGISYLKLDYNINPGAGTDVGGGGAGDGLLGHARAYRDWLIGLRRRHPALLIENCSSGAMRMDYALLGVVHLQSTSDQQDFRLYPPIAASAPASIVPEQAGNWAYPSAKMTHEETSFALVTGLAGRLYLSGFLHELRPDQQSLVAEAVALHRRLRAHLVESTAFWPLGLPGWEDETIALGLRGPDGDIVAVWNRSADAAVIELAGVRGAVTDAFPQGVGVQRTANGSSVTLPPGPAARLLVFDRG
ncbi:MAG TPA: glycoside hydrolase family 36 protein [Humibacter sp.]|nr:glycoside hydrolase family 36 protein [Humibacter sp.]